MNGKQCVYNGYSKQNITNNVTPAMLVTTTLLPYRMYWPMRKGSLVKKEIKASQRETVVSLNFTFLYYLLGTLCCYTYTLGQWRFFENAFSLRYNIKIFSQKEVFILFSIHPKILTEGIQVDENLIFVVINVLSSEYVSIRR